MFDDDDPRSREQRAGGDDGGPHERAAEGRREDLAHLRDLRLDRLLFRTRPIECRRSSAPMQVKPRPQ